MKSCCWKTDFHSSKFGTELDLIKSQGMCKIGAKLIIEMSEKHRKFGSELITRANIRKNIIKIEDLEHILYLGQKASG